MSRKAADDMHIEAEQLLREKELQYRSVFEATSDGLVIYDVEREIIVEVNPAFCNMHGYRRDELVGATPVPLLHPDFRRLFAQYREALQSNGHFETQAVGIRRDGSHFHIEVHGSPFLYKGTYHLLGVVRDVTERVHAYQVLEQHVQVRTQELSALLRISHNVASTLDLDQVLGLILDQLGTLMDYTGAAIFTLHGDELALLDYRGPIPKGQAVELRFKLQQNRANREVILRRRPVIIADIYDNSRLAQEFRANAGEQLHTLYSYIRSWMGVPLIAKEQLIGMLTLDHSQPNRYSEHHAELALAIANQAAIAIENARLYEQAQELATLQERQRLARELHDSVSQALYGIGLGARTARTWLDRDPARAAEPLDYVLSLAEAALAEMRALIFELHPEALASEGLVAALGKQATSLRARHAITVRTALCAEPDMPFEHKVALYRIAQEALHNMVKHARASEVRVKLSATEDEVTLEIEDNGQGFDPTDAYPGHLGLHSMRERAAGLGGTLRIDSTAGEGTRIRARIPR